MGSVKQLEASVLIACAEPSATLKKFWKKSVCTVDDDQLPCINYPCMKTLSMFKHLTWHVETTMKIILCMWSPHDHETPNDLCYIHKYQNRPQPE